MTNQTSKVKTLFLYSGFAEDQSNACMAVTHETGFRTILEALNNIAHVFKNVDGHIHDLPCCVSAMENPDYHWCPMCGLKLDRDARDARGIEGLSDRCNDLIYGQIYGSANTYEKLEANGWMTNLDRIDIAAAFIVCGLSQVLESVLVGNNIDGTEYLVTKVE